MAALINNKTGKEISTAIQNLIIDQNGIPDAILSDNGLEFRNKYVEDLLKKNSI